MATAKDRPKIDLVRIGLDGMDVEAELAQAAERPVVDLTGFKITVIKPKDPMEAKAKLIADKLISVANATDAAKFMSKEIIIQDAGVVDASFGKLMQKVQSYLRREDAWALQKLKKKGMLYYYVIKFSDKAV